MNELFDAIQFHLGRRLDSGTLNHYSLIGVESSSSEESIKKALKEAAARWNASDTKSDPESAKRVAALLKEAQATLLNPERRAAYDLSLSPSCTLSPSDEIEEVEVESNDAELWASFDPARSFHESRVRHFGDPEERWHELVSAVGLVEPPTLASSPAMATSREVPIRTTTSSSKRNTNSNATARIESLKRRRKQKQILVAGLLTFGALGFLGFATFRYIQGQKPLAQVDDPPTQPSHSNPQNPNPSQRPDIPGITAPAPNASNDPSKQKTVRSNLPSLSKDPSNRDTDDGMNEGMTEAEGNDPAMNPGEAMVPPDRPEMKPEPKPMPPKTEMEKPADSNPTMAGKGEWSDVMKSARLALEKADFPTFHKQIEAALPLSKSDAQETKRKRLDQLGQLYEIGLTSMTDAKKKLKGTESITVGKNKVSIVEVRDDVLIVRQRGSNERFAWNEIPMGIALAISNFSLSETDPTDVAARAVYLALSPKKNELYEKTIRELFEKSLGKGDILADLDQALTDIYE